MPSPAALCKEWIQPLLLLPLLCTFSYLHKMCHMAVSFIIIPLHSLAPQDVGSVSTRELFFSHLYLQHFEQHLQTGQLSSSFLRSQTETQSHERQSFCSEFPQLRREEKPACQGWYQRVSPMLQTSLGRKVNRTFSGFTKPRRL